MDFSELCALVGALRDRVAELEAKEAARSKVAQVVNSGPGRFPVDAISSKQIQAAVADGVRRGLILR